MKNSLSYREQFRRNITLAYPVVLSQLGQVMVAVVDSAMVGQTGSIPLAAASLANSITFIMIAFAIGISYAITPLIAAADGQGRAREISEILRHGLVLNIFAGLMIFILIASGSGLLHYMGQDPEVVELAIPYMGIIAFSIVPLMVFQTFRQFTEGLSQTRQAMVITIASNLLNIFLNYLLFVHPLPFPVLL